jgi:hypothetical protein
MSIVQGSALPNVTETTTTTDKAPAGYTGYLENLAKAGSGALTKAGALDANGKPTTVLKTGADLVAGYDPMQGQGYNQLQTAVGAYQPGLTAAGQTAGRAAQGITPERIQSLMNPYTTNVVNEMARLTNQNMERNLLPGLKAGFVGTGGLGSQRYAGALGQSLADMQANLTGQQTGALSAGYGQALKGALDEAQLMNLAAKTQADIAKQEQDLGLLGAGALTKAGAERQKYEQSLLDAPLSMAKEASSLMRGLTVPVDQTKTFTGPKTRDYYQQSNLDKIAGALSFVRSLGPSLPDIGNSLTKFLTGASKNIDVGGGRTIEFDKNGNPTLKGDWQNVSGDLAGTLPTQAELESWGLVQNESGGYDSPADASWADWSPSGDGVDYTDWWEVN